MTYILALDQGTSSTRAVVFALDGSIIAIAQEELKQYYPHNGWVEHDPEEIWSTQLRVANAAIKQADQPISAIGITNQRETVVIWERRSGKPIHRAIVWQDRRSSNHCAQLKKDGCETLIREHSGLLLDPYFSATKIAWILDHVPGARARAVNGELACGTIDSWLAWNLSQGQEHITDVSNAARTSLMNIHSAQWDEDLLQLFRIPRALLPHIRPSATYYFHCSVFGSDIPVSGIAGDQHAALFGQRCTQAGMAKCTYGTGAFIMAQCEQKTALVDGLLSTIAWQIKNQPLQYALEGAVFSAGSSVQWLRDKLGIIDHAAEIETLATQNNLQNSNDVFFVPAFSGLGTPYWDPQARACIVGLNFNSDRSHIARACLDGIAHQACDVLDAMHTHIPINTLRVDGGAAANALLLQIQADYAQIRIERPQQLECTALGAAWLAAIGNDLIDQQNLAWHCGHSCVPQLIEKKQRLQRQRWQQAVARSVHWIEHDSK